MQDQCSCLCVTSSCQYALMRINGYCNSLPTHILISWNASRKLFRRFSGVLGYCPMLQVPIPSAVLSETWCWSLLFCPFWWKLYVLIPRHTKNRSDKLLCTIYRWRLNYCLIKIVPAIPFSDIFSFGNHQTVEKTTAQRECYTYKLNKVSFRLEQYFIYTNEAN